MVSILKLKVQGVTRVCSICGMEEGMLPNQQHRPDHTHSYIPVIVGVLARRRTLNALMEVKDSIRLGTRYHLVPRSLKKNWALHSPTGTIWSVVTASSLVPDPDKITTQSFPTDLLDFKGGAFEYLLPHDKPPNEFRVSYVSATCVNTSCKNWDAHALSSCTSPPINDNPAITICKEFMPLWGE